VQFAVGFQAGRGGWWVNPLLDADLALESPFNTYLYYGLPPRPDLQPRAWRRLRAVAYPMTSSYLFIARPATDPGGITFRKTYLQHLATLGDDGGIVIPERL